MQRERRGHLLAVLRRRRTAVCRYIRCRENCPTNSVGAFQAEVELWLLAPPLNKAVRLPKAHRSSAWGALGDGTSIRRSTPASTRSMSFVLAGERLANGFQANRF